MKTHFLLWRESFCYSGLDTILKKKLPSMRMHYCANDFNMFCSLKIPQSAYSSLIEKIQTTPGVRKVISFPVVREMVQGPFQSGLSLIIALRMPVQHNRSILKRVILKSSPQWADEVDGIFSYLICFAMGDKKIESFLRDISSKHAEYIEPLILLPQII